MEFASYNTVYSVQQIVVVASEFTGVARGFMINISCGPQGQKVEKHFSREIVLSWEYYRHTCSSE